MLKITIELYPATGGPPQLLGIAKIVNDGTGDLSEGNYHVIVDGPNFREVVEVKKFARLKRGAWELLYHALAKIPWERELGRPHVRLGHDDGGSG